MDYKIEFDILKGLLIIFVITGHLNVNLGFDVFWFHMPAFFMVTGYLTKNFLSYKDIILFSNTTNLCNFRKFYKFIIPYFSYCILFFIIFHPENIIKNLIRILYGGWNNITIYSYPYWYINALMVGLIYYGSIKGKKYSLYILIIIYLIIHTNLLRSLPRPLPWGIDEAFGAVIFIALGDSCKKINLYKPYFFPIIILPFLFIYLSRFHYFNFELNMQKMIYNNLALDLIIPISFTILLLYISKIVSKVPYINNCMRLIGNSCITIYFTHTAFILLYKSLGMQNLYMITLITVLSSTILHHLFKSNRYTSFLFIGKNKNI